MKEYLHTTKEPIEVTFLCEECGEIKTLSIDEVRKLYVSKIAVEAPLRLEYCEKEGEFKKRLLQWFDSAYHEDLLFDGVKEIIEEAKKTFPMQPHEHHTEYIGKKIPDITKDPNVWEKILLETREWFIRWFGSAE